MILDDEVKAVDYPGLPDLVRISREPFVMDEVEIEFLREGELQGRIYDVPSTKIILWLELQGLQKTRNMELACDAAWSFGEAVYIPSEDRVLNGPFS